MNNLAWKIIFFFSKLIIFYIISFAIFLRNYPIKTDFFVLEQSWNFYDIYFFSIIWFFSTFPFKISWLQIKDNKIQNLLLTSLDIFSLDLVNIFIIFLNISLYLLFLFLVFWSEIKAFFKLKFFKNTAIDILLKIFLISFFVFNFLYFLVWWKYLW